MKKSRIETKDLMMGRADVLLRFLQLISKDKPKELDPYLEGLDTDTELRPLVDQIVDRIIAGDKELYDKYQKARREVGSRNPYTSSELMDESEDYEKALGYFMTQWSKFESTVRGSMKSNNAPRQQEIDEFLKQHDVPDESINAINYIRQLRNQVVHGIESPPLYQLRAAGQYLEILFGAITNSNT